LAIARASASGQRARTLVQDKQHHSIGFYVWATHSGTEDLALMPAVRSSAQVCHFGGPTGINMDVTHEATTVEYYGWGIVIGDAVPGRTAVAHTGFDGRDIFYILAPAAPGDSGAPVMDPQGRAVGLLVNLTYAPRLEMASHGRPHR
jgi:hypothetical protein